MAQIARPASTVGAGAWSAVGAASLHAATNDQSDSTYAETTTTSSPFEVALDPLTDPVSSTGHVVTFRVLALGSGGAERLALSLVQGTTTIAGPTNQTITRNSFNNYTLTLSGAEADAITDYTDLRIVAQASMAGGETLRVSNLELSVPDAPTGGIEGTLAVTLDDATLVATGTLPIDGSLAGTLADATLVAAGELAIEGTATATLDDVTLASAGELAIFGALTSTLADVTLVAAGSVGDAPAEGELAVTLGDVTLAATGALPVEGALAATLDGVTLVAAGALAVEGTTTATLDGVTLVAAGESSISGALAATLEGVTLVSTAIGGVEVLQVYTVSLDANPSPVASLTASPTPAASLKANSSPTKEALIG